MAKHGFFVNVLLYEFVKKYLLFYRQIIKIYCYLRLNNYKIKYKIKRDKIMLFIFLILIIN